ncbi:MAG: hypothetical protein ACD_19C00014G0028 [uncultured bacterium]|nr:MAG: hypothetical protein ACD_19C00014G0028 [uncultured bacterium]
MQTKLLNYRVIVEPEIYPNGDKVYNAYCPTLGITDYGDTIEEALASLKDGIELAVESLAKEKQEIPSDNLSDQIVTQTQVQFPIAFA